MSRFMFLPAFLLLLPGCLVDAMYGHLPNAVRMEPAVYPLSGLNGPYDDFNAVAGPPPLAMDAFIAFASNDASRGGRFSVDAGRLVVLQNPFPDRRQFRPPRPTMAPFVCEDLLFFASNRPGGRGGFDLYVSWRTQSGLGPPRNLQDLFPDSVPVNTAGNEFRPSVLLLGFEERPGLRLLLFSSDRPGGVRGYDRYLTSLPGF